MIEFKNVYKKFKEVILFEDVNIQFPENQKILIKGINGSGKSILLKLIVGYSRSDEGRVIVDQKQIGKDTDFIENAGVMINAPEFMKNMTGMENLLYLANIQKKITKEEILKYVHMLQMDDVINKKYKTYSLGMKQKLRIIQAIMEHPKYLILDEPFDALDNSSQQIVMDLLNAYIRIPGNTMIFTSHNPIYEKFAHVIYEIDAYNVKKIVG